MILRNISKHLHRQVEVFKDKTPLRCVSSQKSVRKPSYYHSIGKEPLVYRNVGQHLDITAEKYGSSEAIVSCHENKRLTFAEARTEADRLAAGLVKLGLCKGDAVAIWAPNSMQWYLTMLAVARAGLVSVGINPAFQGPEVQHCLQKAKIKAIVAAESFKTQNYYEILQSICPELRSDNPKSFRSQRFPFLKTVIIDSVDALPGAWKFNEVMSLASNEEISKIAKTQNSIIPDSPCNIQFTSGTTGTPKAAIISHFSMVNNGIYVGNRMKIESGRLCVQVPLFHAYGINISLMNAMSHGAALVLPSASFSPEASLKAIVNEKCTFLNGTPTMYVDLINKQRQLFFPLKTLRTAMIGAAPCSPQLLMDMQNVLGLKLIIIGYGLSEGTAMIFQTLCEDSQDVILNTVGHFHDHLEAMVVDSKGRAVPFGEIGELCVRGYATMLGYLDDEAKTKEILNSDKWLKTGDQFILEENGYGTIIGRLKEMIIRGGENIFPKEIEDLLNTHPDIIESHVIGVDDERLGEDICAFVRLHHNNGEFSRSKVLEFCEGRIAHFKIPRYIVVVKEFPKTTSGKVEKTKLKEMFKHSKMNMAKED